MDVCGELYVFFIDCRPVFFLSRQVEGVSALTLSVDRCWLDGRPVDVKPLVLQILFVIMLTGLLPSLSTTTQFLHPVLSPTSEDGHIHLYPVAI